MEDKQITLRYRLIRWLVRVFSPKYRPEGTERLPEEGCVIVGNHCQMYGPIAAELYTPGRHDIWCAGEMMQREEVADYAFQDFWSQKPKAVRWFYRLLSHIIPSLSVLVFTSAHTIPVYRDARLTETFKQTLERLEQGSRVVIFPECYDRHNNIVYRFQDRFIDLARFYYRRSGKALQFVPLYLAPKLSRMVYGDPVVFQPDRPIREERERIAKELMDRITALAEELPEHTVVPYPNLPKRRWPRSLPVEVYEDET